MQGYIHKAQSDLDKHLEAIVTRGQHFKLFDTFFLQAVPGQFDGEAAHAPSCWGTNVIGCTGARGGGLEPRECCVGWYVSSGIRMTSSIMGFQQKKVFSTVARFLMPLIITIVSFNVVANNI